jgi:hypothetical protein
MGRRLWQRWKVIALKIGDVQARLILGLLYFLLVGPIALVRRLMADPLGLRRALRGRHWIPRPPADPSLDAARKQ